jgi:hypothetical protein
MNQQNQIELYLQQLKSMGMNDEMIEMYRQQITISMQYTNDWTQQFTQLTDNMKQINQLFSGDASDETDFGDLPPVNLSTTSSLTPIQKWAVACGANLMVVRGEYLNDLSTGLDKKTARQQLSEWWDIDSKEELIEMVQWLTEEGHRDQFDIVWQAISTVSIKESKEFLREYVAANEIDEEVMLQRLRNMRDALETFQEDGFITESEKPVLLVWDYARLINICRAAFDAGYIKKDEALQFIVKAAKVIQGKCHSWQHLSVSYLFGWYVWSGNENEQYDFLKEGMQVLLSDPTSPWVTLSWSLPLEDV